MLKKKLYILFFIFTIALNNSYVLNENIIKQQRERNSTYDYNLTVTTTEQPVNKMVKKEKRQVTDTIKYYGIDMKENKMRRLENQTSIKRSSLVEKGNILSEIHDVITPKLLIKTPSKLNTSQIGTYRNLTSKYKLMEDLKVINIIKGIISDY